MTAKRCLAQLSATACSERLHGIAGHPNLFQEALLAVASKADPAHNAATLSSSEKALAADPQYSDARRAADLALLRAFAGRQEEAIREALRAIEMASDASAVQKNDMAAALAAVYAQTGEAAKALDLIEHLLTVPVEVQRGAVYSMTLTDLKWCWIWYPLRAERRIQKLVADPEPKTVY
jgi:tetratricopeptide (TPR) repeat protein